MQVTCGNCGAKIRVPDSAVGKKGKCPKCATVMTITPDPEEPAPPPAAGGSPFDFGGSAPEPPAPRRKAAAPPPVEEDGPAASDEADDAARDAAPARPPSTGLSMASLICGILGVLCCGCFPAGIAAIVLGFMGKDRGGRGMAVAGIILGVISIVESCGLGVSSPFWMRWFEGGR